MRLPNKIFSYRESVLSKLPYILKQIANKDLTPKEVYLQTKSTFKTITEFLNVLDCLFALGVIEYDDESGALHYVK